MPVEWSFNSSSLYRLPSLFFSKIFTHLLIVDRVAFQCGQKSRGKTVFKTKIQQIHEMALVAARDFKKGESQLLQALLDVDKERVSNRMANSSFHTYCVEALHLSDTQAYTYDPTERLNS